APVNRWIPASPFPTAVARDGRDNAPGREQWVAKRRAGPPAAATTIPSCSAARRPELPRGHKCRPESAGLRLPAAAAAEKCTTKSTAESPRQNDIPAWCTASATWRGRRRKLFETRRCRKDRD